MSEETTENQKPGKLGYLREQYKPKREEASKDLEESGLQPGTAEFRKARARVARKYLTKELEGEMDAKTGILNQKGFMRRANEEARRTIRAGSEMWLFELDVNNLKEVNDAEGHVRGDKLLKNVASILNESTRAGDIVARVGGDEFMVLLRDTSPEAVDSYWERVNRLFIRKGIKISAGASEVNPRNLEGSMKSADEAMYEAKAYSKQDKVNHLVRRFLT